MTAAAHIRPKHCAFVQSIALWLWLLLLAVVLAGQAFAQYLHHQLSKDEVQDSNVVAGRVRSNRTYDETQQARFVPPRKLDWYRQEDANSERFSAVGQLLIVKITQLEKKRSDVNGRTVTGYVKLAFDRPLHCSAFFVASNILATAAHCLRSHGVRPRSPHVIIFRQQFDGTREYAATKAATHESVVTEWIYLEEFTKTKGSWCYEYGYDFAFLRTSKPMHGPHPPYTLKSPHDYAALTGQTKLHAPVIVVGYPKDYAKYYELLSVSCVLRAVDDTMVTNDVAIQVALREGKSELLDSVKENQVACIGPLGNMQTGGSGGPWLLDEAAIDKDDPDRKEKLRWVLGIQSLAFGRNWNILLKVPQDQFEEVFLDNQKYCRASLAAKLNGEAISMYKRIIGAPDGQSFKDALTGGCSAKPNV